ncbi:hypothetical protein FRAAL4230 [Frankia alni ACN14a]|uniref:Uncharacterized protein n=1 Tax=Frankia alni (strain DSM 45986 / CECT 9034 / ACN14a) TaxID=326424 RepID=Q0RI00_FRAAA|nr:hypothetical protein FRAAL4230 [Frankia alni ACN14a]
MNAPQDTLADYAADDQGGSSTARAAGPQQPAARPVGRSVGRPVSQSVSQSELPRGPGWDGRG